MRSVCRREFLKKCGAIAAGGFLLSNKKLKMESELEKAPNFLIVLFDDTGWTDFNCYGGPIPTPNIDRFANEGMKFTNFYAPAPNCSPTRAGLLTGRIPSRVGVYSYLPPGHVMHLPAKEITIANLLQDAGYETGLFGKWHLSKLNSSQPQPNDHGFKYWIATDNNADKIDPDNFIRNGEPVGTITGSACQIVIDEALGWIDNNKEKPFFVHICFHETHSPVGAPQELIDEYEANYPPEMKPKYLAMVDNADQAVGRLMEGLEDMGLSDNTFVLLASDNGPINTFSRGPLREKKSWVYEGGIREPGLIRWPGNIVAGSESDEPVSLIDVLPTFCDIAGIKKPTDRVIDGMSILPVLKGEHIKRKTPLFWYFYRMTPAAAMREGDWVIIASLDEERNFTHWLSKADMPFIKRAGLTDFELYNLKNDIGQTNDLAASEPGRLEDMKGKMIKLHAEIIAEGPYWNVPADYKS